MWWWTLEQEPDSRGFWRRRCRDENFSILGNTVYGYLLLNGPQNLLYMTIEWVTNWSQNWSHFVGGGGGGHCCPCCCFSETEGLLPHLNLSLPEQLVQTTRDLRAERISAAWQPCVGLSSIKTDEPGYRGFTTFQKGFWLTVGKDLAADGITPAQEFTAKEDLASSSSSYAELPLGLNPAVPLHTYSSLPYSSPKRLRDHLQQYHPRDVCLPELAACFPRDPAIFYPAW